MFYSKKVFDQYQAKNNQILTANQFNEECFFSIVSAALSFVNDSLINESKSKPSNNFDLDYLNFSTKTKNATKKELINFYKKNNIEYYDESELATELLLKTYLYNQTLKKAKSFDNKSIINNIFLYFYCGIFMTKAKSKESVSEVLTYYLDKYEIIKQVNKMVDTIASLNKNEFVLNIIYYLNWNINLLNVLVPNGLNLRPIILKEQAPIELEMVMNNNQSSDQEPTNPEPKFEKFELDVNKIKNLKEHFNSKIIGQPKVIEKINEILIGEMYKFNKKNHRPIGVLFFVGPTGVGKTETVKEMANFLYGSQQIHRFDMSEYKSEVAIQKLIGAPNGYVGYQEGGTLTNAMQKNPNTIVLFDEIEKADKTVFDLFLQIIDEGFVTSNKGVKSYFDNTIIVFTSNIGVSNLNSRMGYENIEAIVKENVQYFFDHTINRPELFGRIGMDNVVVFNLIDKQEDLFKILDIMFKDFIDEYEQQKVKIKYDRQALYKKILEKIDLTKGARDIRNKFELFKKQLFTCFFENNLNPNELKGITIEVKYEDKLTIKVVNKKN